MSSGLHAFAAGAARGDHEPGRRRGVQRSRFKLLAILTIAAVLALAAFVIVPLPSPLSVAEVDPALARRTVRGAFHVHTTRSDGSGDTRAVARAAQDAGLQFVVMTDHGDGTRPVDKPEYVEGVLCVDAVEISTNGGHYIALDAAASPYPLGGESRAAVEDVARLGGFGIAAHPGSARRELAWTDWGLPVDGVEWLNADSEWRDESRWRLTRSVAAYPFRPAAALASLLDRPQSTLSQWDAVARSRRVLGIAGHDAHGGVGARIEQPTSRRRIHVPSYNASFRAFSTRVELDRPFTGGADADSRMLFEAFRRGSFYTSIDAIATASTLEFTGQTAEGRARQGSLLPGEGPASFKARAAVPTGATMVAFRDGVELARRNGGTLEFESRDLGAYRVEVHVAGAPGDPPVPWIVSNPVFRLAPLPPAPIIRPDVVLAIPETRWRIEKEERSAATIEVGGEQVTFEYRLRSGDPVSQFAAAVTDLPSNPPPFEAVTFTARSAAPARVSVQLRYARDGDARWGRSVFLDATSREVTIPLAEFRRADGPQQRPDSQRATSLLFVVDLTNARPGASGTFVFSDVTLTRLF